MFESEKDRKMEQRTIIKFFTIKGEDDPYIQKELENVYKEESLKKTTIFKWKSRF